MSDTSPALAYLDQNREAALTRLFDLLKIESISTDPAYSAQCVAAADVLVDDLKTIGFDAKRIDSKGHPFVLAHGPEIPNKPRILFYGHYDVQPVDPLNLWTKGAPFEPAVIDHESGPVIHGRGASDDKGQIMTFVEACRAIAATGEFPLNITILFEGEEESGSPSLPAFLDDYKTAIDADIALICDTGMIDADTPAIATQLRGMLKEEIVLRGAKRDLHSGLFGGAAANPAQRLAKILAGLHDDNGRITLPGFYEGVEETPQDILEGWQALEPLYENFLSNVGLSEPAGETGRGLHEQIWARPTCEINGMNSGYTGVGFKTVLPAEASAKISFRLVGKQDPDKIRKAFRAYVEDHLDANFTVEYLAEAGSAAVAMDIARPEFEKARAALATEFPGEARFIGMGGSIPIVSDFKTALGIESMLIGFALDNDNIHAPNEKYALSSFERGARAWVRILEALAR